MDTSSGLQIFRHIEDKKKIGHQVVTLRTSLDLINMHDSNQSCFLSDSPNFSVPFIGASTQYADIHLCRTNW